MHHRRSNDLTYTASSLHIFTFAGPDCTKKKQLATMKTIIYGFAFLVFTACFHFGISRGGLSLCARYRKILATVVATQLLTFTTTNSPELNYAVAATQIQVDQSNPMRLKLGLREVNFLLENWEQKTTYCNFGEFQNELLLPENKDKLFKAAAEFSILDYDKSKTMNVMCKRDPQVVRAFLGLTPDNLLLNKADVLMRRPSILNLVDEDSIEDYLEAIEAYTRALSEVDSLAYEARTDFASTETAAKGDNSKFSRTGQDYLAKSKISVIAARDALATVVDLLHL